MEIKMEHEKTERKIKIVILIILAAALITGGSGSQAV